VNLLANLLVGGLAITLQRGKQADIVIIKLFIFTERILHA
jgi:hypothetical protein